LSYQVFINRSHFVLESGRSLPGLHLAYTTHGQLNAAKDNAVWIFHALTANSDPAEWWPGLVGSGKLFDPEQYFIVCVNMPGSCYGSIGPLESLPEASRPWYYDFPFFTTRDMIRAYQPLREFLGIRKIRIGIGGSMGGQQLLEWAIEEPALFEFIFPIATNAVHSPWGIAFNTAQRMSIEADGSWGRKSPDAGMLGMKAARATALLSYRHYDTFHGAQLRSPSFPFGPGGWDGASSYQRYQGEKLARRFSALSYYVLSQSMDTHDVSRKRGTFDKVLACVQAKTLAIGIESDILFPLREQEFIAAHVPGAIYRKIGSSFGHDGFLLEYESIGNLIREFIRKDIHKEKYYQDAIKYGST
jgi:homoserine O-acetyltransferase